MHIKPKSKCSQKISWRVSSQAKAAVTYYAQFTGYTEDEIVNMALLDFRTDLAFQDWLKNKRRNKRAWNNIFSEDVETIDVEKKDENGDDKD